MINTSSDPTYKLLWKYPAYKLVCNFANIYPNNTVVLDHLTPRMSYLCDLAAHNQKKKIWTRGSSVIVPGVELSQNELIRWIFPKRSTKYRTMFVSIGDAGDTKNLFVDVWTRGSIYAVSYTHLTLPTILLV